MPKLKEILFGKKAKNKQLDLQTKDQKVMQKLIQQGLTKDKGPLADLFGSFDEAAFKQGVTDPSIKEFQEKILPQLQEQFINSGQTLSTGFGKAQLQAGNDLQSKLAQLMYQAREGQKQNRIGGVNTALGTKGFENLYRKETSGAVQGFANAAAESAGKGLGNLAFGGGGPTPGGIGTGGAPMPGGIA